MLSFIPRDVLDEILDYMKKDFVSEFPSSDSDLLKIKVHIKNSESAIFK